MSSELDWLPPHECELILTHNTHKSYYQPIADYVADERNGAMDWVSPEEQARAIATDNIWELQWYPHTPIGFNRIAASSLSAIREYVLAGRG
jgi:hypothetical protein